MSEPVTKTVFVRCPVPKLFDFLADAGNWPRYAFHNILAVRPGTDGWWVMDTPRGIGRLRIEPDRRTGVLDHVFVDAGEGRWVVPARVVSAGNGAVYLMTFTKPGPLSDEAFQIGMRLLDEELHRLKAILEGEGA